MRNQFTFYKSFDDVIQELTDKQIATYMRTMLDVQFLRVKIEDVKFNDPILHIVWKSQKHSIETSIKGYLDSQKSNKIKNPYLGIYEENNPIQDTPKGGKIYPSEGVAQQDKEQEQVQDKEQGKDKDKVQEVKQIPYLDIVQYLNSKVNAKYMPTAKKTKDLIKARFNEGFTIDDFKTVIDKKSTEWLNDKKMSAFLRPETLFSNKFEGYLNQVVVTNGLNISNVEYVEEAF